MNTLKRPIVSRFGGKAWMVAELVKMLPQHRLYCEPFTGGARLFFAKGRSQIEILNDKDDMLINLYKVVQNDTKRQELINRLQELPYSRSIFNHYRQAEPEDEIEKAVRFFYLSKSSFAADIIKGGFGVPSRNTKRNPAMTYQNSIDTLEHIARRLKGVTIECLDYAECIRRYDSPDTLFYCDPPYFIHEDYYGEGCFSQDDHYKLSELLYGIKGKVAISHCANEIYDSLYQGWYRHEFQSFKGSHKAEAGEVKPKTIEVVYSSFKPVSKNRSLFDAL